MVSKKKSINFLPEVFQTEKNDKFLSSVLDPLLETPQLERIDGYVGSKLAINYDSSTDFYLNQTNDFRNNYSLEPALIFKDENDNIDDVVSYEDIINELSNQNIDVKNLDKIFKSKFYAYDPLIDWDKLINFSEYYWLPNGPDTIVINQNCLNVETDILGNSSYLMPNGYYLSNGMKIKFLSDVIPALYADKTFVVEGVGSKIKLVDFSLLIPDDKISSIYNETFDNTLFDEYPFDGDKKLPLIPDYITINKSSNDLNPWSRYNRWFHSDVIKISALINNRIPTFTFESKAKRPIIEFKPNIQLFNFGKKGIKNVDLIDNSTTNAFRYVQNSSGYYVDGVLLEPGYRVIFNNDLDDSVRGKIYIVEFDLLDPTTPRLNLIPAPDFQPQDLDSVSVNYGNEYAGISYYFDSVQDKWVISQQHDKLNQAPLFDLFNNDGISFSKISNISDFKGNYIFGYDIGSGIVDNVLGFSLNYKNSVGVGSYLFKNYFMSDVIKYTTSDGNFEILSGTTYIKINDNQTEILTNVWNKNIQQYRIPIIEIKTVEQNTSTITIDSLDVIDYESLAVYVNNKKQNVSVITGTNTIVFNETVSANSNVVLKIVSDQIPNNNGYYETPLSLTNNPLNGIIDTFTLTELTDHLRSMIEKIENFNGNFPGISNLRDISDYEKFGTRLVVNANPISFVKFFLGKKNHNVIDALTGAAEQYSQFKNNLINKLIDITEQTSPANALDSILIDINKDKTKDLPFYRSDMLGFGPNKSSIFYTVSNTEINEYPFNQNFNNKILNFNSLLVYVNDEQLLLNYDYIINVENTSIVFYKSLNVSDKISIIYYSSTLGTYIPPTPTKLGLYPKFKPEIYDDYSFVNSPLKMIRGHDGSLIKAYNDYRDQIILEYEKRIYNNIKIEYNKNIFDVQALIPGKFRNTDLMTFNKLLSKEFLKWSGKYNVNYEKNTTYEENNFFTWNNINCKELIDNELISGTWKSIFKYFYDTYEPNIKPWEMLGFTEIPSWWENIYGLAPYTSQNNILWQDLEQGYNRNSNEIDLNYARPGLLNFIPVDEQGNLKNPQEFLISGNTFIDRSTNWIFSDYSPAEVAWRNSSYFPFAINIVSAVINPCDYTSYMYDLSRTTLNPLGQVTYKEDDLYLDLRKLIIDGENNQQISGFGVYVKEIGNQKNKNYNEILRKNLSFIDFNLFHKLGGFSSKEKLQINIDSVDPISRSPGIVLPLEDYRLILNVSSPLKVLNISGIIIQKNNNKFVIKGYDKLNPIFKIFKPVKNSKTGSLSIGGVSEKFTEWSSNVDVPGKNISSLDLTSANSVTTRYYKQGQIVRYENKFYRVKISHNAASTFDLNLFQQLPELPKKGGVTVLTYSTYDSNEIVVPYGTEFNTVQETFDFIIGYGVWLERQGFVFDEFNLDLNEVINWKFSGKEFLYWTLQNWNDNNLITLSPFANILKFKNDTAIVDNIFNKDYEYLLLNSNGNLYDKNQLNFVRKNSEFTIKTLNDFEGLFFASIRLIQKEHAIVFNNFSIFNDTLYDIETGYKQQRVKLSGFKTKNWNGDIISPGFVYDKAEISEWESYRLYNPGQIVKYRNSYFQSKDKNLGTETFNFAQWTKLNEKPSMDLIPNFDYKINQFEDFYSLDIDNFDFNQQKLAQRLVGYSPRNYLTNIFSNAISQYKFYQGFIKEKGTKNALDKISKANNFSNNSEILINEEWAFRTGFYGGYSSYNEIEFTLLEGNYLENPYVIKFENQILKNENPLINFITPDNLLIIPEKFNPLNIFGVYENSTFDDNNLKLINAGYVRLDDVTATAFNKNSILDIANNDQILKNNTIWTGFLENGDWTVYRYRAQSSKISGVYVNVPGLSITFVTDTPHDLNVGDIVSIVKFNDQVNGVYIVQEVPKLSQFTVASELTTIINEELLSLGILFKFETARYNHIVDLKDEDIFSLEYNNKFWIDSNLDNKWTVLEKINNFNSSIYESLETSGGQQLGYNLYTKDNLDILIVSSPGNRTENSSSLGKISVFKKYSNELEKQFEYELNSNNKVYCDSTSTTEFGAAIDYSEKNKLFIIGAPSASKIRAVTTSGIVTSTGTELEKEFIQEGLVKISSLNTLTQSEITQVVLVNPDAITSSTANYSKFGQSIFLHESNNISTMIVGAPGDGSINTGTGKVYVYNIDYNISGIQISEHSNGLEINSTSTHVLNAKSQWGFSISGSQNGELIAISAPGYQNLDKNNLGIVQLFDKDLNWIQNLLPSINDEYSFGYKVLVSNSRNYIFVSSIDVISGFNSFGKVFVYKFNINSNVYEEIQILKNPLAETNLKFGISISLSADEKILTIGSIGTLASKKIEFLDLNNQEAITTFDGNSTFFTSTVEDSGTVYIYEKIGDYFIQADELNTVDILEGSKYGISLVATNNQIFVGAPSLTGVGVNDFIIDQNIEIDIGEILSLDIDEPTEKYGAKPNVIISYESVSEFKKIVSKIEITYPGNGYTVIPTAKLTNNSNIDISLTVVLNTDDSRVYQFNKIDNTFVSLKVLRLQDDLVEVNRIKKVTLLDNIKEEVVDYLEVIDPLKGKISGIADQELSYKSVSDPAIYSFGLEGTMNDPENNWLDEYVGKLWWDLSTAKFMWYEQGEEIFRKNNWGNLFPGAAIDVYEWVKSDLLPSEWAAIADTNDGLTKGISGQPKFPDNSVVSVKQIYNNITGAFENVYYYWVKNKTLIPNNKNRRISALQVANIIADPVSNGIKFISILSKNSIALSNIQPSIVGSRINLNVVYDSIDNALPKHTEWILLEEGNPSSLPTSVLEKKLIDSLLGHDLFGNVVPDPKLTYRNRYGIGIRPQQTLFKDRIEALRNIVEFANSILIKNRITDNYSFENLLKEEEVPIESSGEFDQIFNFNDELSVYNTSSFIKAEVVCFVNNGSIRNVLITNPGYGYTFPPEILIKSAYNLDIKLQSVIDNAGRLVEVNVINAGKNLLEAPILEVRPHTVIILSDNLTNKWSKNAYDYKSNTWRRVKTQTYNTPLYWSYVDWISEEYNEYKLINYVVSDISEALSLQEIVVGDYVKVKNSGNGKYIILEKINSNSVGNYSADFNIVYAENGTIQIRDEIWNSLLGKYIYDSQLFDEKLYDQTPDLEISYILKALKEDIFINDLKVNWNLLFFVAVKYALSEQKLLDWAFKTSFVSLKNKIGNLDQRTVYKLDNDQYFESFINEIKPYKTQIRNYTVVYDKLETSNLYISDFDLPSYFDNEDQVYKTVDQTNSLINEYPWKTWNENNTFQIDKILIANPGKGYTQRPTILINTQQNDSGSGATAEAYIRNGELFEIKVTNSGSGYKVAPSISIIDNGGSVTETATASVILKNEKIRKNILNLKFDRLSTSKDLETDIVTETFVCDGTTVEFDLKWSITPRKENIVAQLDGRTVFATDYTILYTGIRNRFSTFVFLNYVPTNGQILKIEYYKNVSLYNAVDRISNFYSPTDTMEGNELSLLMDGITYPNTVIQGLPFNYATSWNPPNNPYGTFVWDNLTENYSAKKLIASVNIDDNILVLDNVDDLTIGQNVLILNTSTNRLRKNTLISNINTVSNTVELTYSSYDLKSAKSSGLAVGSTLTFTTKKPFYGNINVGDSVRIFNVSTPGYNDRYIVTGIDGNDTFTVIQQNDPIENTIATLFSTARVDISSIKSSISYNDSKFDTYVVTATNTSTIFVPTYTSIDNIAKFDVLVNDTLIDDNTLSSPYYSTSSNATNSRLEFIIDNLNSSISNTININLYTYTKVEFWKNNTLENFIDTSISGGSWNSSGNFVGALGINPEEFIINGDSLVSGNVGHGPEELVPGHVLDSLGINVYTKSEKSIAFVFTGVFPGPINTTTNFSLTVTPEIYSSVIVYSKDKIYNRVDNLDFTSFDQYYIENDQIYLPQQSSTTRVGYTIISSNGSNVLDGSVIYVENETQALVESSAFIEEVESAYVLVNGYPINQISTTTEYGYILEAVNANNKRAAVKVYNLSTGSNTIQAWFFDTNVERFGRVHDEYFQNDPISPITDYPLSRAPSTVEPASGQFIVEIFFDNTNNRRRLSPPKVSYYVITNNQTVFDIESDIVRDPNYYSSAEITVYINGSAIRSGFDYTFDTFFNTVTLLPNLYNNGDVVAIMILRNYEYLVINNVFKPQINGSRYRVISFESFDDDIVRTETFVPINSNRYTLSRPVINDNYIWVYVNGNPLIHRYDFEILQNLKTIQFSEWITTTPNDKIVITTVSFPENENVLVGYRIFKNMLDKVEFKRISNFHTTYLTKELTSLDTEIHVNDDNNLITPNPSVNKPGIVLIDSERIEYFNKDNNVLSQLRRGTFGTLPAPASQVGSTVIDQSFVQSVPYVEETNIQKIITSNTTTYYINKYNSTTTNSDGILLKFPDVRLEDQVTVYYGGRQLRKDSLIVHDINKSYDPDETSLITYDKEYEIDYLDRSNALSYALTVLSMVANIIPDNLYYNISGSGTISFADSIIFVKIATGAPVDYDSLNLNSIYGEMVHQRIKLNINEYISTGTEITIIQKKGYIWTGTESLISSDVSQAKFLRNRPASLPDIYYYGGTRELTDNSYFPLTNENDDPLEV